MRNLYLLVDPVQASLEHEGRIAMYDADDVAITNLYSYKASELEELVSGSLKYSWSPDSQVPLVKVQVAVWKKARKLKANRH